MRTVSWENMKLYGPKMKFRGLPGMKGGKSTERRRLEKAMRKLEIAKKDLADASREQIPDEAFLRKKKNRIEDLQREISALKKKLGLKNLPKLSSGKAGRRRKTTKRSKAMIRALAEEKQRSKQHGSRQRPSPSKEAAVERLPFRILPPGKWTSDDIINYYKRIQASGSKAARKIQWKRIRDIQKLRPVKVWVGEETWNGYVVYEFDDTQNVVLECPVEGNAVYVLKGNAWKSLIQLSKGEIRDRHPGSFRKVVHRGEWLARIQTALNQL